MANNGKDTKHTSHISRRVYFLINGEECNHQNTVWCEGVLQLADIGTNSVMEDDLNPWLGYARVRLEYWQNTCQRGVIGYRTGWRIMCSEHLDCIELIIWLNEFEMFIWV